MSDSHAAIGDNIVQMKQQSEPLLVNAVLSVVNLWTNRSLSFLTDPPRCFSHNPLTFHISASTIKL